MAALQTFSLPLQPHGPPPGFGWEDRGMSQISTTTAFRTGIDQRDVFRGRRRCVICGEQARSVLQHCHIISESEPDVWLDLKDREWIPPQAKEEPRHEPRDGLLMCSNHHNLFDSYEFFIRYLPQARKFVLVNHSRNGSPVLETFHGKAIALDITDRHAPFPSIFILHEVRVRAFHPFQPDHPIMPQNPSWQDWILSDDLYNEASGSFRRAMDQRSRPVQPLSQIQPTMMNVGETTSGGTGLELNQTVIDDILAATRAMPSWKACVLEGTSWAGTAEENIEKYVSSVGVEED